jgi:hypothetical protein
MTELQNKIEEYFGVKRSPNPTNLVKLDGYDVLEKEAAIKFFSGKSWNDVLDHLRSTKNNIIAGADFRLEEWSVLDPDPRYYYLRAYLEYLLETLATDNPDEQYISELFHQLYQTVYMYKTAAYNDAQKVLLCKIASHIAEIVKSHKGIEYWGKDITDNINLFLSELKNNG